MVSCCKIAITLIDTDFGEEKRTLVITPVSPLRMRCREPMEPHNVPTSFPQNSAPTLMTVQLAIPHFILTFVIWAWSPGGHLGRCNSSSYLSPPPAVLPRTLFVVDHWPAIAEWLFVPRSHYLRQRQLRLRTSGFGAGNWKVGICVGLCSTFDRRNLRFLPGWLHLSRSSRRDSPGSSTDDGHHRRIL